MICVSPLSSLWLSQVDCKAHETATKSRKASREKRATKSREHPKRNIKTSFILRLLCSNICEFALLLLLNQLEFPHDRSPVCFWCCYAIRRLGYIASVFCVSLPGKHISLVICVRGHTYHGETHITVTPPTALNNVCACADFEQANFDANVMSSSLEWLCFEI